jgi:hypothetical protein
MRHAPFSQKIITQPFANKDDLTDMKSQKFRSLINSTHIENSNDICFDTTQKLLLFYYPLFVLIQ